jgi:hypothetical protein
MVTLEIAALRGTIPNIRLNQSCQFVIGTKSTSFGVVFGGARPQQFETDGTYGIVIASDCA